MPVHPDLDKKLFGFIVTFATGERDMGLIVATDAETARLQLENDTFACYAIEVITDQRAFIDQMLAQRKGLAYFTRITLCN